MSMIPIEANMEGWGRLQVVINGVDRTFYRGIPTIVESWSFAEPFGDSSCILRFPGITSYEQLDNLPFRDFQNVDIWRVNEDNERVGVLWEGFIASTTDDLTPTENGLTVECVGALHQADFFLKVPSFGFYAVDTATAIVTEMNARRAKYGGRWAQMPSFQVSNNLTRANGSYNKLLTEWAAELLATSFTPAFMYPGGEAFAIQCTDKGYWIMDNYGSIISFGERMPNYGSVSWLTAVAVHLANPSRDERFRHDLAINPDGTHAVSIARDGNIISHGEEFRAPFQPRSFNFLPPVNYRPNGDQYVAIEITPDGQGIWACDNYGRVYTWGNATYHGGSPSLASGDRIIDMAVTPDGSGYRLLSWRGAVYSYGSATTFFALPTDNFPNILYTAIECTNDGGGYWVLNGRGEIWARGNATNLGMPGPIDYTYYNYKDMCRSAGGNGYAVVRNDGRVHVYGDQPYHGSAEMDYSTNAGGNVHQYTMVKAAGRVPIIRVKDTWTVHWETRVGTPGITHSLTRDRTQTPNVFYGSGTDLNFCSWRNTKYPNAYPFSSGTLNPPPWPGYVFGQLINQDAPAVLEWQRQMQAKGWGLVPDGVFDGYDADVCRLFQKQAGLPVHGLVDNPTWQATFEVGSQAGHSKSRITGAGLFEGAYIAPLAADTRVDPFLYSVDGSIRGANPNANFNEVMRVETYHNFGENSSKFEAIQQSNIEMKRNLDPGYIGTITLATDPEYGSRFNMRAGQNLLYKDYRGRDELFHIAGVEVDAQNLTVTLTVDTKARDMNALATVMERERTIAEWPLQPHRMNSKSKQIKDGPIWDCESSAGFIPRFRVLGQTWNVVRIPVGDLGTVVKTEFKTTGPASAFSVAFFDKAVTAAQLNAVSTLGPGADPDYYEDFPDGMGLLIAWGAKDQMAGFYPRAESDGTDDDPVPVTGDMVEVSDWNYWCAEPPWLYVAVWPENTCYIEGRIYPGQEGGFNLASQLAIAMP